MFGFIFLKNFLDICNHDKYCNDIMNNTVIMIKKNPLENFWYAFLFEDFLNPFSLYFNVKIEEFIF